MGAMTAVVMAAASGLAAWATPQEGSRDAHSASAAGVASQSSRDGVSTAKSAKRVVRDGKVVEAEGAGKSAGAAGVKPGGGSVTRKYVKVVKDGKVVEESGDPALARDLGLGELKQLGLEVEGLEPLLDDLVGELVEDLLAGKVRAGESVRKGVKVNGVPVDAHVEVKSGADALREFERRCPELKGDLARLLEQVGDASTRRVEAARKAKVGSPRPPKSGKAVKPAPALPALPALPAPRTPRTPRTIDVY